MAHHRKNLNTQLTQHSSQNDALLTAQNSSTTGITALNTKLDSFSGHTNNTITIGDGSTQLRTVPLGYDRTNGKAVSFLVDSAGHQQIDAVDVTAKLDTLAGAGNNNIGEGSSKLQIYNYGRDVSAGNYKPMVVNSSGEQILALSAVDNAVLDTIATNTANIKISTDSVNLNVDTLEALQTSTNTKLDTIETSADALISANHTDLVAIEASLTSMEAKQDTQVTHLSEIEGAVETLEGCVGSNKVNVNISSGGTDVSGLSTHAKQDTIIGHLDGVEGKLDTIDGSINTLEACVGSSKVNVNISSGNISGFATSTLQGTTNTKLDTLETTLTEIATDGDNIQTKQDTIIGHLDGVEGKLDTIETTNNACQVLLGTIDADTNDIKTAVQALDNAVDGNYLNVNQNVAGADVAVNSGNKGSTVPRVCIATDDIPIALVNTKLDHLSDNLDTLETTLTEIATDGDNVQTLLTTLDGVQDNVLTKLGEIETTNNACQVLLGTIDADTNDIKTAVQALDNAVDGNYLNVNQNVAGADVAVNSGNKGSTVPRVCIATDDIPIALVNTKLDHLSDNLDTLETTLTEIATDGDNVQTLLTTLDGVQDNILTKLGEIETTNNANQVLLGTIDADTNDIKTAVEILDDIVQTEDTAHSSGHKGVMSLVVRQDSQADFGADGDYVPMSVNGSGELRVTTGGGSVSKTVLNRTTARDLATNGSHSDYEIDTGTEANFISFYINFIDATFTENDLQVHYSESSDFSNHVVVFQGSTMTIIEYLDGSSNYNRAHIELKNPSRYVRLFNNDAASVLPINNSIIIHGRE